MSITNINTDDLRHMEGKEGLILMGCGGDLQEWVDQRYVVRKQDPAGWHEV